MLGEFAGSGLVNLVGGCCGTTPAHIERRRRGPPRARRRASPPRRPAMRLSGLEPLNITEREPVRQRRRAHQHHRLGPLPQAHQGRRLRHRPHRRRPAGRERRPGHRRQHGRRDDRRRRGDGPLPQAGGRRARHLPGAGDGRLLQVGGDRGRPEVCPGQGHRQLDLPEGGGGDVPRPRPAVPQVRRRRGGDGLRRGRPGRHPRADARRSASAPTGSWSTRWASPPRTSSSTPTSSPSRPASRSTRPTAGTSSRPRGGSRGTCRGPWSPAASPTCQLLLPWQQPGPRGHPRRLPVPRHPGGPRHGHRQRGRAGGLRRGRARAA